MKANLGAWRALSNTVQADIATAVAAGARIPYVGEPMEPEPDQLYVNDDEVSGEIAPTKHRLLTRKMSGKIGCKAYPHLIGLIAAMAMGKDTATKIGESTVYKHKIEADKAVKELPYRTLIENDGNTQAKYAGVACSSFTISGERGGFINIEAEMVGSGAEAADATAAPAIPEESYLTYQDVGFNLGGAFAADAVTGGTDLKGTLLKFSLSFKNSPKSHYKMGDASGNIGRIQRAEKIGLELKADFELDDTTHRAALLAGTESVLEIPLVGGLADDTEHFEVRLIVPRVIYRAAKKGASDGLLVCAAEFQVMADGTNPPLVVLVQNLFADSFLKAAA